MIAKRILSPKGGAGFQRLGGYVLNVQDRHRSADPASWQRLNAYILDDEHAGEKVAWARMTNCASTDAGWAVKEIIATQARNTRSRRDKSYHLVVSFPEGERPSREVMEAIEDRLCEAIGLEAHQRVSAVHQNTDHWHLHLAISTVHPTTFRNVSPFGDHWRLQEACAELELKHGLTVTNHTLDRTAARDRAEPPRPFLEWVRENALPGLLEARDAGQGWQGMHQAAAEYGLVLRLRGAGLVISHALDRRLHVKASDADRGLSLGAMTAVIGAFKADIPVPGVKPARESYTRPQRSGGLHERFKRERDEAERARAAAALALREQQRAHAVELAAYYRTRMAAERAGALHGPLRRESVQHVVRKRSEDRAARIAREAAERRQVREAHPVPGWQGWLEAQAAAGDAAALAALRERQQRAAMPGADALAPGEGVKVEHVIHRQRRPAVRRNGAVIYRAEDGGLVADEAAHVRVAQLSPDAARLALMLAVERFGTAPLVVRGSEDFRRQVAGQAGQAGLPVAFADRALDAERRRHARGDRAERGRGE